MQVADIRPLNLNEHVYVNETLCPVIFQTPGTIFTPVKSGLINIANYWWQHNRYLVGGKQAVDVVFYGDLAGYVYNRFSEVSLGLVFSELSAPLQAKLPDINDVLTATETPYTFINRPVHCHILAEYPQGVPCFSIVRQKWINTPLRRQLAFSMAEFCQKFPAYQQKVRAHIEALSQHANGMFTIDGCRKLEQYLQQLRLEAQTCRAESSEHEYNINYLLWRTFATIGGEAYFRRYLTQSYDYNLNELELA